MLPVGIELAPRVAGTEHGPDVIQLEADGDATADELGFPDGAWSPDLSVEYTLEKTGTDRRATGTLRAMTAPDRLVCAQAPRPGAPHHRPGHGERRSRLPGRFK